MLVYTQLQDGKSRVYYSLGLLLHCMAVATLKLALWQVCFFCGKSA
jgi:hypothetical protein